MAELTDKICKIDGVVGASIVDRDGAVIEKSYHSESAKAILDSMTPSVLETVRRCEVHDPELQHLRMRFEDLSLFAKIYQHGCIVTLCQSDLIFYLLDSSLESIVAENGKLKAAPSSLTKASLPPAVEPIIAPSAPAAASLTISAVATPAQPPEPVVRPEWSGNAVAGEKPFFSERSSDAADSNRFGVLYGKVLAQMRPYFNDAAAAERLLQRQIRDRLKISADQLSASHLDRLAEWVATAAGLLIDKSRAVELGNKIRKLK